MQLDDPPFETADVFSGQMKTSSLYFNQQTDNNEQQQQRERINLQPKDQLISPEILNENLIENRKMNDCQEPAQMIHLEHQSDSSMKGKKSPMTDDARDVQVNRSHRRELMRGESRVEQTNRNNITQSSIVSQLLWIIYSRHLKHKNIIFSFNCE